MTKETAQLKLRNLSKNLMNLKEKENQVIPDFQI